MTGFLVLSTSMTLNDLELATEGVLANFLQVLAAAHISRVNCDESFLSDSQLIHYQVTTPGSVFTPQPFYVMPMFESPTN